MTTAVQPSKSNPGSDLKDDYVRARVLGTGLAGGAVDWVRGGGALGRAECAGGVGRSPRGGFDPMVGRAAEGDGSCGRDDARGQLGGQARGDGGGGARADGGGDRRAAAGSYTADNDGASNTELKRFFVQGSIGTDSLELLTDTNCGIWMFCTGYTRWFWSPVGRCNPPWWLCLFYRIVRALGQGQEKVVTFHNRGAIKDSPNARLGNINKCLAHKRIPFSVNCSGNTSRDARNQVRVPRVRERYLDGFGA